MDYAQQLADGAVLASVRVQRSPLGGLGVFATHSVPRGTTVMRVPRSHAYDLDRLLEVAAGVDRLLLAPVLRCDAALETAIVRNYVWALAAALSLGAAGPAMGHFAAYLRVLQTTAVLKVADEDSDDALVAGLVRERRRLQALHATLAAEVPQLAAHLPFEAAYQLHLAVKLRVLEIPHEVDPLGGDYTTSATLVPVLDYVNHSFRSNAVFDVDRGSGDIVLRLEALLRGGDEVLICYEPHGTVNHFLSTYGFVEPRGDYEWRVPRLNAVLNEAKETLGVNYEYIAKWLQISPTITVGQLQVEAGSFPLLLIPGLEYNAAWAQEHDDIRADFAGDASRVIEQLQLQEQHAPIVQGLDNAYGVLHDGAYVSLSNLLAQTWDNSPEGVEQLLAMAVPALRLAIDATLAEKKHAGLQDYYALKHSRLRFVRDRAAGDLRLLE